MRKILSFLILLAALPVLHSCDEDYETEMILSNYEWHVQYSSDWTIYNQGDSFLFYADGAFEAYGRGLHEYGSWRVRNGRLLIRFDHSPYDVDIEADLPVLYNDYVRLDCMDYTYNTTYTLRLVRGASLDGYGYGRYYVKPKSAE